MIELKIPIKEAVNMLTDRMEFEFKLRKETNAKLREYKLENLPYKTLLSIAEVAAFDLIFLLPLEVFEEENNLADIISKSMRALADVFVREEFLTYKKSNAEKLIGKIHVIIEKSQKTEIFSAN